MQSTERAAIEHHLQPAVSAGQVVFDVQTLRRQRLAAQEEISSWDEELKLRVRQAEARLKEISGLDLAVALIEFGRITGQRVKI